MVAVIASRALVPESRWAGWYLPPDNRTRCNFWKFDFWYSNLFTSNHRHFHLFSSHLTVDDVIFRIVSFFLHFVQSGFGEFGSLNEIYDVDRFTRREFQFANAGCNDNERNKRRWTFRSFADDYRLTTSVPDSEYFYGTQLVTSHNTIGGRR